MVLVRIPRFLDRMFVSCTMPLQVMVSQRFNTDNLVHQLVTASYPVGYTVQNISFNPMQCSFRGILKF